MSKRIWSGLLALVLVLGGLFLSACKAIAEESAGGSRTVIFLATDRNFNTMRETQGLLVRAIVEAARRRGDATLALWLDDKTDALKDARQPAFDGAFLSAESKGSKIDNLYNNSAFTRSLTDTAYARTDLWLLTTVSLSDNRFTRERISSIQETPGLRIHIVYLTNPGEQFNNDRIAEHLVDLSTADESLLDFSKSALGFGIADTYGLVLTVERLPQGETQVSPDTECLYLMRYGVEEMKAARAAIEEANVTPEPTKTPTAYVYTQAVPDAQPLWQTAGPEGEGWLFLRPTDGSAAQLTLPGAQPGWRLRFQQEDAGKVVACDLDAQKVGDRTLTLVMQPIEGMEQAQVTLYVQARRGEEIIEIPVSPAAPEGGLWTWTGNLTLDKAQETVFEWRAEYGTGSQCFSMADQYAKWQEDTYSMTPGLTKVTGTESRAETIWFEVPGETEAAEWHFDLKSLFENGGYGLSFSQTEGDWSGASLDGSTLVFRPEREELRLLETRVTNLDGSESSVPISLTVRSVRALLGKLEIQPNWPSGTTSPLHIGDPLPTLHISLQAADTELATIADDYEAAMGGSLRDRLWVRVADSAGEPTVCEKLVWAEDGNRAEAAISLPEAWAKTAGALRPEVTLFFVPEGAEMPAEGPASDGDVDEAWRDGRAVALVTDAPRAAVEIVNDAPTIAEAGLREAEFGFSEADGAWNAPGEPFLMKTDALVYLGANLMPEQYAGGDKPRLDLMRIIEDRDQDDSLRYTVTTRLNEEEPQTVVYACGGIVSEDGTVAAATEDGVPAVEIGEGDHWLVPVEVPTNGEGTFTVTVTATEDGAEPQTVALRYSLQSEKAQKARQTRIIVIAVAVAALAAAVVAVVLVQKSKPSFEGWTACWTPGDGTKEVRVRLDGCKKSPTTLLALAVSMGMPPTEAVSVSELRDVRVSPGKSNIVVTLGNKAKTVFQEGSNGAQLRNGETLTLTPCTSAKDAIRITFRSGPLPETDETGLDF